MFRPIRALGKQSVGYEGPYKCTSNSIVYQHTRLLLLPLQRFQLQVRLQPFQLSQITQLWSGHNQVSVFTLTLPPPPPLLHRP